MKPLEIQNVIEEVTRRVIALSDSTSLITVDDTTESGRTGITVIGDKVISTQQLNELPDGLAVIQVDSKSLITPAAADWLNEQNIDVQRVDMTAIGQSPNAINGKSKWKCISMGSSRAGFESFDCIVKASSRCREAIENGDRVVLITDSTSVALIALNRNQNMRAIEVRDVNKLRKDANTTYANVLVVGRNAQSTRLIRQIKLIPRPTGSPPEWL